MQWVILASVFILEVLTILMSCGVDHNGEKFLGRFSQLNDHKSAEIDSREMRLMDDRSSFTFVDSKPKDDMDNDYECIVESDVELECAYLKKTKNLRKKKKRKNYKWSRKKTHFKVNVPSFPKFTVEDTCISDSLYRDEAVKTLEVAKILDISFFDNDETIINKMMELELEEWNMQDCY